jgi:gas vesicle protein
MSRGLQFVEGLVLGAALSAAVVLLFVPQSGVETRQMILDRAQEVVEEGRRAAEERRLELTVQFERLKEPVTQA